MVLLLAMGGALPAAERERPVEAVIQDCRSADPF